MTIYIALLRGINVGGKNKIKMTELKLLFERMGFSQVQTYINSGNVLFESQENEETLVRQIEDEIERTFFLSIKVVLRTSTELVEIIASCPYKEDVAQDGKNVNIGFMNEAPSQEGIDRVSTYKDTNDFQILGREIHLLFRQSVGKSKLAKNLQKLSGTVTIRNWNTINKLANLAKEMVI
jgi:uncharacterized protein (DUF1697 family)